MICFCAYLRLAFAYMLMLALKVSLYKSLLLYNLSNYVCKEKLLLLMTILAKTLLALVRRHLMTLVLLSVWHNL